MNRITSENQEQKALSILVDSYFEAENVTWMLKKQDKRSLRSIFKLLLSEASAKNGAYISSDERAVLLLFNQNQNHFSWRLILKKMYVFFFITGVSNGFKILKLQKEVSRIRPKNGLLGMALAVEKNRMNTQTIFELKRFVFDRLIVENQEIYAETTVPRLSRLYTAIGLDLYSQIQHPYAPLTVYFLKFSKENISDRTIK